jgi:hypothetical protein
MQNSDKDLNIERIEYLNPALKKRVMILSFVWMITLFPFLSFAQLTEMGLELGVFNFTGDLASTYNLRSCRPGASLFLKSNLNKGLSLRYGISGGWLSGNDSFSNDPFNQIRNKSFDIFLFEGFGLFEFNFLDYRSKNARIHWTPYLNFGVAVFTFWGNRDMNDNFFPVQPAIPMGVGIRYELSKKLDIGIEASTRATFFDHLDGVSGSDNTLKDYTYGNQYDFDAYYFIGISINYVFYFIPCPFDYN